MTAFEYEGLPHPSDYTLNPIPDEVVPKAEELAVYVIENSIATSREIKMGRVFSRRGQFSVDPVGAPRNTSYGSKDDDLLITLTLRVPVDRLHGSSESALVEIDHEIREINTAAKRAALQAEIDAAEATEKASKERADQLRNQLKEL